MGVDYDKVLALEIENYPEPCSLRGFLQNLLLKIVEEEESFNGKRPFGDSGWLWGIWIALHKGGYIAATTYKHDPEDEEVEYDFTVDQLEDAQALLSEVIKHMCKENK